MRPTGVPGPGRLASTHWVPVGVTALISVVATVWAWPYLWRRAPEHGWIMRTTQQGIIGRSDATMHTWVQGDSLLDVSLSTSVDHLAAVMMVLACGVALLVQVYSTAYLGHHVRYRSYATIIVLFLLGMLAVVTADDLFVLLVGWEVMGLCSYLLISHEWESPVARSGAVKAFLVTRFGDVGLLLAIIVIGHTYGTYSISSIVLLGDHHEHATAIGLLLLLAIVGKSAQFPLHTWLPDAMPGPTPISALIHAATMVAAGVYLALRLHPLLGASQLTTTLLAIVSCVTMLLGALFALVQSDLKRALAWSTVSQLAYMFAAVAAGGEDAAEDHLLAHGAFKALLFLGAGCLMHAVGSSALADMGGLRRRMPVTFWTMTVGFAALAGIVPTAGFFSKDEIVDAVHHATSGHEAISGGVAWLVLVVVLLTAVVTAAYATRLWLTVFLAPPGTDLPERHDAHEAPLAMTGPLVVLAVATFALSLGTTFHLGAALLTTALAGVGVVVGWGLWRGRWTVPASAALERELGIDRVLARDVPAAAAVAARATTEVDRDGVDVYSRALAGLAVLTSRGVARLQSGNTQRYATLLVVGAVLLAAIGVLAGQGGLS